MSAENCPFEIIRDADDNSTTKKDKYIEFEIKIGTGDNAPTVKEQFRKLESTHPEDVLDFIERYDQLVETINTAEGRPRF